MAKVILFTEFALKCIADGVFGSLGSDGPTNNPAGITNAFRRVRKAHPLNLIAETQHDDFDAISPMPIEMFVQGDCAVFTDDKKSELWLDALKTAKIYWEANPKLPNPFPASQFAEPGMDCEATRIIALAEELQNQWEAAQ